MPIKISGKMKNVKMLQEKLCFCEGRLSIICITIMAEKCQFFVVDCVVEVVHFWWGRLMKTFRINECSIIFCFVLNLI
jgi:hypothetical protein